MTSSALGRYFYDSKTAELYLYYNGTEYDGRLLRAGVPAAAGAAAGLARLPVQHDLDNDGEPDISFRTGDILLVEANDLRIGACGAIGAA